MSRALRPILSELGNAAATVAAGLIGETIASVDYVPRGVMTHKFIARTLAGEAFVVRFYPPERSAVVDYEPDVIRRCRNAGVTGPEVIGDSRLGPPAPLAYTVYRMIPGRTLSDCMEALSATELRAIARQIAGQLQLLSTIPVDGFGDLLTANRARFRTWKAFVLGAFDEALPLVQREHLVDQPLLDALLAIRERIDTFPPVAAAVLAWSDASPDNIIVNDRGKLAGIIDFEGCLGAELHLTLGYLQARYRETALYDAIAGELAGLHDAAVRTAFYVVVRALRLLAHALEPLPTGQERTAVDVFLPELRNAARELLSAT